MYVVQLAQRASYACTSARAHAGVTLPPLDGRDEKEWDLIGDGRQMATATWRSLQQKHVACTYGRRTNARTWRTYDWLVRLGAAGAKRSWSGEAQ